MSTFIGIFLVIISAVVAVLVFGMANMAGRYDELSDQIYREELSRRELEDALTNPECISPEEKLKARSLNSTNAELDNEDFITWS